MYAVIKSGGKQHRVEEGEQLKLEKIDVATGETLEFDEVLMVGSGSDVKIGAPLVEGGKGIAVSSGESSGAWAKAGGVGTFSGVNADSYDDNGNLIPQVYKEKTRSKRNRELVDFSVSGAIEQAKIARDIAGDKSAIHYRGLNRSKGPAV